jgi:DNA-binding MarR family transcriptional regulator
MMNALLIHEYLERLTNLFRSEERKSGVEFGLQPVQLEALHYLAMCNRYSDTPLAVAEYLGLTKGTVSQTLLVLEAKGLVTKIGDVEDRRLVHLQVTPTGRRLLEEAIPASLLRTACASLSEEKQAQVVAGMKLLLTACLAANQNKTFGVCRSCRHHAQEAAGGGLCGLLRKPLTSEEALLICREHTA